MSAHANRFRPRAAKLPPTGPPRTTARAPRHPLAARIVLLLALILALPAAVTSAARADEPEPSPPVLLVDGEEVPVTLSPPRHIGHAWYVPAGPIAEALWAEIVFDPATLSVTVTRSLDGVVMEYVGTTGEGLRDHAYAISLAPGLPRGTGESDLMLPLELVQVLFDVEALVSPWDDEIHLMSRGSASGLEGVPTFGMREFSWRGWANRAPERSDGGMDLDATARAGRFGRVDGHFTGSVDPDGRARTQSAWGSFQDGGGNTFTGGDLRGSAGLRWLGVYGRGGRWDGVRRGGRLRLHGSAMRLASGTSSFGASRWNGSTALLSVEHGARPGAPVGSATSLGSAFVGGRHGVEDGMLLGFEHRRRTLHWQITTIGGLWTSAGEDLRRRTAGELHAQWFGTRRLRMQMRVGRYEREFRLPTPTFADQNSRFARLGAQFRAQPWLTFATSHSSHEDRDENVTTQVSSESMSITPTHPWVDSFTFAMTQTDGTDRRLENEWSTDTRGSWPHGDWFHIVRHRTGRTHPWTMTLGASVRTTQGLGQLASSWTDLALDGVSLHWSRSFLKSRMLRITAGGRWSAREGDPDPFLADVRLSWDFAGGQGVDVSWDEQPEASTTRMQWRGRVLFPEAAGPMSPGVHGAVDKHVSRLTGRVYLDHDLDGEFGEGDRPLRGVTVVLDDGMQRTKTEADGSWGFAAVRAGRHVVSISPVTIRADLSLLDPIERRLVVPAFKTATVDWRTCVNLRVRGVVFRDDDGDGRRGPREEGLADVLVAVEGGSDTLTDGDGAFRLGDVPPGEHRLVVDAGSLPEGHTAPPPVAVALAPGQEPPPLEIPVRPPHRDVLRKIFD